MDETTKESLWQRVSRWPYAKDWKKDPKQRLIAEMVDIFGLVICSTIGGVFLTFAAVIGDKQSVSDRYESIVIGIGLILFALGFGIARRITMTPALDEKDT